MAARHLMAGKEGLRARSKVRQSPTQAAPTAAQGTVVVSPRSKQLTKCDKNRVSHPRPHSTLWSLHSGFWIIRVSASALSALLR